MLTKLSGLLRDILRHRDSPFVYLADEVNYGRTWLEIAQARFGDRLRFEIDVPEKIGHLCSHLCRGSMNELVEELDPAQPGTLAGARIREFLCLR